MKMTSDGPGQGKIEKTPPLSLRAQLVEKILQKTREKRFLWDRTHEGYQGRALRGGITASLAKQSSSLFGESWRIFIVKRGAEEILKLSNDPGNLSLLQLAGVAESDAHTKVSELLGFLNTIGHREIKAAISELDEL
jgi:hypothetical protein